MQSCDTFIAFDLNSCPETIAVIVGLAPSAAYTFQLKNKFGRIYQKDVTTDETGKFDINIISPLKRDMFRSFSGAYELRIFTKDESDVLTKQNICAYDYIVINFNDIVDDSDTGQRKIEVACS